MTTPNSPTRPGRAIALASPGMLWATSALLLATTAKAQSGLPASQSADNPTTPLEAGLELHNGEQWVAIPGGLEVGAPALPLPLLSRSESVLRARLESRGVRVRFAAGVSAARCEVRALMHAPNERVSRVDGQLMLVGPALLPYAVTHLERPGQPSVLPEVARLDAQVTAGVLGIELQADNQPEGSPGTAEGQVALLAWPGPEANGNQTWSWQRGPAGSGSNSAAIRLPSQDALLLPAEAGLLELQVPASGLDQLVLARIVPLDSAKLLPVSTRPGNNPGELWLQVPRPAAGQTATLLLTLLAANASAPVEAAAPSASAEPAEPWFDEQASALGLAHGHLEGPDEQLDIRPTMGPGAAWGDLDGDGWFDLFSVQGGSRPESRPETGRFFLNQGQGSAGHAGFLERSDEVGDLPTGAGMGALFFEANGDGHPDLFVAQFGENALLLNTPGGSLGRSLKDRSEALSPHPGWNAGAAAADVDLDGDLDLYVTTYLVYDEALMPPAANQQLQRDDPPAMLPYAFPGGPNALFINSGAWQAAEQRAGKPQFVDEAVARGVADATGRGMQAVFFDQDGDGDQDLYVANDVSPNALFENDGQGVFQNVAFDSGVDDPRGGMGLSLGDVDLDGDLDLFLSNWELDANALYVNNLRANLSQKHRTASFTDIAVKAGLAAPSIGRTGWGAELFDAEADGDLDLFVLNGYTSPDYESTGICVGQPAHFFLNDGSARFEAAFELLGPAGSRALPSRCLAPADFDQDGDLDFFATSNNGPARMFVRNTQGRSPGAHWLAVRLKSPGPNPCAIGAEVTLDCGEFVLVQEQRAGSSYLAGNPTELLFQIPAGIESATLGVRWPDGQRSQEVLEKSAFDRRLTLEATR